MSDCLDRMMTESFILCMSAFVPKDLAWKRTFEKFHIALNKFI